MLSAPLSAPLVPPPPLLLGAAGREGERSPIALIVLLGLVLAYVLVMRARRNSRQRR